MTTARICRWLAVAIALAGLIDPAISTSTRVEPIVSVITSPDTDATLADRVARRIDAHYTVLRRRVPSAAAVISVGRRLPDDPETVTAPAFAVVPARASPAVRITDIRVPRRASRHARIPVTVSMTVTGAEGHTLDAFIVSAGVEVDRVSRRLSAASERVDVVLTLVPPSQGPLVARVTARLASTAAAGDSADVAVSIDERTWPVLVFDARPSWMSTFVRRALEDDTRFTVAARSITSRTAATATPNAPALNDAAALARYAAIVIGAPDALNRADVDALETYLRTRGGAVVALLDMPLAERAVQPLLRVDAWAARTDAAPTLMRADGGAPTLQAADVTWPSRLPPASVVIAAQTPEAGGNPIVWQAPLGAGRIIVSGALDSWRYRASEGSGFDEFWRRTVAAAAGASPDPIELTLDRTMVSPGVAIRAHAVLRDVVLADLTRSALRTSTRSALRTPGTANVSAFIDGPDGRFNVRMWPSPSPGELDADVPGMTTTGTYQLTVSNGDDAATAEWVVAENARLPHPPDDALLTAWAKSRRGNVMSADRLDDLADWLDRVVQPGRREVTWHPLREAWWIAPFALLLGAEWWLRRRAGQS